jgi:hypothetical protein
MKIDRCFYRKKIYDMTTIKKEIMSHLAKDTGVILLAAGTPYLMYLKELSPFLTFGTALLGFVAMSFKFTHDFLKYIWKPYKENKSNTKENQDD